MNRSPRILLTGFGSFEVFDENPTEVLARELDAVSFAGGELVSAVLPVSFQRAPRELMDLVERFQPSAVICTGVHGDDGFRIEQGAGVELGPGRPDVDGVDAGELPPRSGERLETRLDVDRLKDALEGSGVAPVRVTPDAGRYVCERVYRTALELCGEHPGMHGLFVHVPSFDRIERESQRRGLAALIDDVFAQL